MLRHAAAPAVAVLVALATLASDTSAQTVPSTNTTLATRACLPPHDKYDFCDTSRTIDARVNDLIDRIWSTANATIPQMLTARNSGKSAIPALGVPEYDWGLNVRPDAGVAAERSSVRRPRAAAPGTASRPPAPPQCIHGVQSSCVQTPDGHLHCPVSFPNPVNYGAVWNRSMLFEMGRIVGLETRALWLLGAVEQGPRIHIGLDCWSPNM